MKPIVIYRSWLVPEGFDALCVCPFIFIHPAARNDKGLLEHEMVHWEEQRLDAFWWFKYLFNTKFRFDAEVRAYTRQVAVKGLTLSQAVGYLSQYGVKESPLLTRARLLAALPPKTSLE